MSAVDVLAVRVAGKTISRTTTHVIATPDRIWSQHKSEKAAINALRFFRGGTQFHEMEVMPLSAALAQQPASPAVVDAVVASVLAEVERATTKFPTWPTDPLHASGVVQEESGELAKAVLQAVYEPHKSTPQDVAEEAIQTAAMAIRFLMSMPRYQWSPGEQHEQNALAPKPEGGAS